MHAHSTYGYSRGQGEKGHAMPITVQVRNVYGNDLVYPADETAEKFARLLKVKTFNAFQLGMIRSLGYAIHTSEQLPWILPPL